MKIIRITAFFALLCPLYSSFALELDDKPIILDTCLYNSKAQTARSAELQELVKADQDERENFESKTQEELTALVEHDLERRQRVAAIFAEGCFKSGEDFAAAALVFQHGDVPEHYYQTFLWAKRAVELGKTSENRLMAMAIDRYLVSFGKKQLFGSQAFGTQINSEFCYCLLQVEKSFPDTLRKEYTGISLEARYEYVASLNEGRNCSLPLECEQPPLEPSPKGTVLGFW